GHTPNGTCHDDVCDHQITVNPVAREGSECKVNIEAREAERFTGCKEQRNPPQPPPQARLHLAKRVLNHPASPFGPAWSDNLMGCPRDHCGAGTIVLGCEFIAIVISVAVGHRPATEERAFPPC